MHGQYNFSRQDDSPEPMAQGSVLAIDTGSPLVSVALSLHDEVVAERATAIRQSSGRLLQMIDEVLNEAGMQLPQVNLLLALRGPGSFTGLRVGLATLQGMRMALQTQTATLPTLQVLATLAPAEAPSVTACVDALREGWFVQDFSSGPAYLPLDEPFLCDAESLIAGKISHLVGFGISQNLPAVQETTGPVLIEPGPLATQALRILDACPPDRDPALLAEPLYLRAPAVTPSSTDHD